MWILKGRVEHPYRDEPILGAASLWFLVHQRVRGLPLRLCTDSFFSLPQQGRKVPRSVNDPNDLQRFCLWIVHNPVVPVGLHKPEAQRQAVKSSRIRPASGVSARKPQPAWIASSTRLAASRSSPAM